MGEAEAGGMRLGAAEIHALLGPRWPDVLQSLGIPESALRPRKAGPCPACGGQDRYVFDNRTARGDFLCRKCGPGDGFALLQRVHGWDFRTARAEVIRAAGLERAERPPAPQAAIAARAENEPAAGPTRRVLALRRESCSVADLDDARRYLASRYLWPLPADCALRAHPSLAYHDGPAVVGRYPALVADVRDTAGELVTAHVTYLRDGAKLATHEPRKLLSPVAGRVGVAVRLRPLAGPVLGIAEGIETALAASTLHGVPVWAALNATLLGKFQPPAGVSQLIVFADRDEAGLHAAARLLERLQGKVAVRLSVPIAPAGDWADALARSIAGAAENAREAVA